MKRQPSDNSVGAYIPTYTSVGTSRLLVPAGIGRHLKHINEHDGAMQLNLLINKNIDFVWDRWKLSQEKKTF